MIASERERVLRQFLKTERWAQIRQVLEEKLGAFCWVCGRGGNVLFASSKNQSFCRLIKGVEQGRERCRRNNKFLLNEVRRSNSLVVSPCLAGFLSFVFPIQVEEMVFGYLGGCQIIDSNVGPSEYSTLVSSIGIDTREFIEQICTHSGISEGTLYRETELVSTIITISLQNLLDKELIKEQQKELLGVRESFAIFDLARSSKTGIDKDQFSSRLVKIVSRALNAEICSFMVVDSQTGEIKIRDAVGLDDGVVQTTVLRRGEGIVGKVVESGEPLLVKNINKTRRFKRSFSSDRYYTKSLIISPLKVRGKVIGVLNVNNKATRKPFDEDDLRLLSVICGHLSSAMEVSESADVRERERRLEAEIERLRVELDELSRQRREGEVKAQRMKAEIDRLKESVDMTNAVSIQTQAQRLASLYERIAEISKLYEDARLARDTKGQVVHAEELERLRREAQELETLREQAEELNLLYNLNKGIVPMTSSSQEEILRWVLLEIQPYFNYQAAGYLLIFRGAVGQGEIRRACPLDEDYISATKSEMMRAWRSLDPNIKGDRRISVSLIKDEFVTVGSKAADKIRSFVNVPLRHREKIIGLLHLNSIRENAFSALDRGLLSIIADQVSIAIERTNLFSQIREAAERDDLTKVYNFRYFRRLLDKEFRKSAKTKRPLSLIMLDFDHLKHFNDTYGHQYGNRLIRAISRLITQNVRQEDVIARFGGDEFAVVLPGLSKEEAWKIAEGIRISISGYKTKVRGKIYSITASLGLATYPDKGVSDPQALIRGSDEALYEAKRTGRNRVCVYSGGK